MTEPLSGGERDTVQAGCGQLVLVDRLDAGRPLGPLIAALARQDDNTARLVFAGVAGVYRARFELGIGAADKAQRCAKRVTRLAVLWPRLRQRATRRQ